MRWFKHMSNTLDNPRIQELLDRFGPASYLWYFGTIEFLAREDALFEPAEVSIRYLARKFRTKVGQLLTFYRESADLLATSYSPETERISLFCKKMVQIKDNYNKDLQASTKRLAPKSIEVEVDVEIEKEKPIVPDGTPKFNALGYFIDRYLENLKTKYIPANPKKDGNLLKSIITNHGEDNFKLALSRYWNKKDNFITNRKYDVVAFNSNIGILLTGNIASKSSQKSAEEVMREMRIK